MTVLIIAFQIAFSKFVSKYQGLALLYSEIQTVLVVVLIMEMSVMNQPQPQVDAFTVCLAFVASLSFLNYCKKNLLIIYSLCCIYLGVRTWFWVHTVHAYFRFVSYFWLSFLFIYILSRELMKRERKRFL